MKTALILLTTFVLLPITGLAEVLTLGYDCGEQYSRFEVSDVGMLEYSVKSTGAKDRVGRLQLSAPSFTLLVTNVKALDWDAIRSDDTRTKHGIAVYLKTPQQHAMIWDPVYLPKERGLESLNSIIDLLVSVTNPPAIKK